MTDQLNPTRTHTNDQTRRLLLVKENFLSCSGIFQGSSKKLDKQEIERIFTSYDRVSEPAFRQPAAGLSRRAFWRSLARSFARSPAGQLSGRPQELTSTCATWRKHKAPRSLARSPEKQLPERAKAGAPEHDP